MSPFDFGPFPNMALSHIALETLHHRAHGLSASTPACTCSPALCVLAPIFTFHLHLRLSLTTGLAEQVMAPFTPFITEHTVSQPQHLHAHAAPLSASWLPSSGLTCT